MKMEAPIKQEVDEHERAKTTSTLRRTSYNHLQMTSQLLNPSDLVGEIMRSRVWRQLLCLRASQGYRASHRDGCQLAFEKFDPTFQDMAICSVQLL